MTKRDFNIIVIGGGSAGLVSAYIASAVKAKVALIEKNRLGGDCLNTGCVPSKAIIRTAKILSYIRRHKEFGIRSVSMEFDFADAMERVQSVIKKIEPHDSVERYVSLGVNCIKGKAQVISPHEVLVNDRIWTTKNIIVATGARPAVLNIEGLENIDYLTTDTIWGLRKKPERLLVLGGGPIGCELAQCFARLGIQVTLVEMAPRLLNREDAEIGQAIRVRFENEGVRVCVNAKCRKIGVEDSKRYMVIEKGDEEERIEFDQLLLAVGRKSNSRGFGLEDVGVSFNRNGAIEVDEYLRTTNHPNIYACGDVVGPYQFTHTASHQAWYCVVNALFSPFKKFKVDYSVIPWCNFTDPEVARVGLNEKEAQALGVAYEVLFFGMDDLDRAIIDNENYGFVKVLTQPGKDRILGVTIVGNHAGDLIVEFVLAMKHRLGLNRILGTIHIYPTMTEANRFAAGVWKKEHTSRFLLWLLKKIHTFRR